MDSGFVAQCMHKTSRQVYSGDDYSQQGFENSFCNLAVA